MKKDSKKRLNLGEIIKKLNESPSRTKKQLDVNPRKRSLFHHESEELLQDKKQPDIFQKITNNQLSTLDQSSTAQKFEPVKKEVKIQSANITSDKKFIKDEIKAKIEHAMSKHHEQNPTYGNEVLSKNIDDEEEFDIFKYIGIVFRRKKMILFFVIVATIYSSISYLKSNRFYSAKARMLFRPDQESVGDQFKRQILIKTERQKLFYTHLELLKSTVVLERVSQNLDNRIAEAAIKGRLNISQHIVDREVTDIINLAFSHTNAEIIRDVLNELCKTYIDYRREVNAQEDSRLILNFQAQINKVETELKSKEDALRIFKEDNNTFQLSREANILVNKLSNMELALQKTQMDLIETKDRMKTLKTKISTQDINIIQSMTYENPMLRHLNELELELSSLSADYSDSHFKVINLKSQIENMKKAMGNSIVKRFNSEATSKTLVKNPIRESLLKSFMDQSIELSTLEGKRKALEQIREKLNIELGRLPSLEQRYAHLTRESESLQQTLKMLKLRYEQAKIRRDSQESELKILELAKTPQIAIPSKKASTIGVGLIVGLLIGIAFAFLLEFLDQSIKEPSDIEKQLEIPILGMVPLIETDEAIVEENDFSKSIYEPFRALRANIKHIANQHNAKLFMVCSAIKSEGKTTLATNLAITFAMDNKKVVLIDCDLRRSQIHNLLNIKKDVGLSEYLQGKATEHEIIKQTHYNNFFVITAGNRPHNPAELLGIDKFYTFLENLKNDVDIIICDSPALIPVSDSMTMAPHMDCCIMVVRALWTPLKAAKQAKNQLARIGTNIVGCIFNGVSHSRRYYPYYYGYYGYHPYRYSYDEDAPQKFNFREVGLKIEKKIKTIITNLPTTFPQYTALGLRFINRIFNRPIFWFLIFLLTLTVLVRFYFEGKKPTQSQENIIQYIAPMISPVNIDNNMENNTTSLEEIIKERPKKPLPKLLSSDDLLQQWRVSQNQSDTAHFFSFYDADKFKPQNETYEIWYKRKASLILKNSNDIRIISIEDLLEEYICDTLKKIQFKTKIRKKSVVTKIFYQQIWSWKPANQFIVNENTE